MKPLLIAMAFAVLPALGFAADLTLEEAEAHIGTHGTVVGTLVEVAENKVALNQLEGRQVEISGHIKLHKGCPEIVITKARQIRVSQE